MNMAGSAADQGGAKSHSFPIFQGSRCECTEPARQPLANALSRSTSALLTSRQAVSACSTSLWSCRPPVCPSLAHPSPCQTPASPVSKVRKCCNVTAIPDFSTVWCMVASVTDDQCLGALGATNLRGPQNPGDVKRPAHRPSAAADPPRLLSRTCAAKCMAAALPIPMATPVMSMLPGAGHPDVAALADADMAAAAKAACNGTVL